MIKVYPSVAVLYARSDSCYFDLVRDVFDIKRDARTYAGSFPVVAHPPCRAWGSLRHLAKPRPDEKLLALDALAKVRRFGGVLEHPMGSSLWSHSQLPLPGALPDSYGGFTLLVEHGWWGHPAPKPTYLYIVGISRAALPAIPFQLQRAAGSVSSLPTSEREKTPLLFAEWLVSLASSCVPALLPLPGVFVTSSCVTPADKRAAFRAWSASQ